MNKLLIYITTILAFHSLSMSGQDVFTTPPNYGFLCDEAQYLCGYELDGYNSTLLSTLSPQPQPNPICGSQGSPENTQWISFIADDSLLNISIDFGNCTSLTSQEGLTAGLYGDCTLNTMDNNDLEIDCGTVEASSGTININPDQSLIIPGNIYYLYLDGFAGAVCDFTVNVVSGVCTELPSISMDCVQDCGVYNPQFDNEGCTDIVETFTYEPLSMILEDISGCNPFVGNAEIDSIVHIDWEILPDNGFTIVPSPMYFDSLDVRANLSVIWDTPGTYTIRPIVTFNPLYETCRSMCDCTDDVIYTITISQTIIDTLPLIELCNGMSTDFCGQTINSDQDVSCIDRDNCTITVQEVRIKERVDLPIDTHYICAADCFEFNGIEFCDPNLFNIPHPTACDTFYQIQLIDLELDIDLTEDENLIDCINTEARMTAEYTTNSNDSIFIFWLNEVGDTVSKAESYVATGEGTFTYHAVPLDAAGCVLTISNTVTVDDDIPNVSLEAPLLDCNVLMGNIILTTDGNVANAQWIGPNGFMSNDVSPEIMDEGVYSVTMTTTNGCQVTETVEVSIDNDEPSITVMHDDLDCSENIAVAQYTSTADIASVEWTTPSGTATDDILTLSEVGNYSLTITANNGCTSTETFIVTDNTYDPSIGLDEDYIWRCSDTERIIDVSPQVSPNFAYVWQSTDGLVQSIDLILTVTDPGTYILVGTDPLTGCVGRDTVNILEDDNAFLDIEFEINNPSCFGGSDGTIDITSYIGGEGPYQYEKNGESFNTVEDMLFTTGMHTLKITDVYGCEVMKTFEITSSQSFDVITDTDIMIKYGDTETLVATVNIPDSLLMSIEWTDSEGGFLASGDELEIDSEPLTFLVTATDINGCTASQTINITIDYEIDIFYPNVFSPDGNGVNDYFVFYNNGLPRTMDAIQIFDRAGELIFQQNDLLFNESLTGWNGEFNGSPVQPGVYVFIIQYTLGNGESRTKSGSITVVR